MIHSESSQPLAHEVQTENGPIEPVRVKTFVHFFKNYMSISAVVAAALPIPVTSFKLIPTFPAQTSLLSSYTSLFCFLLLAFIFYSRHSLGRTMFPEEHDISARIRALLVGLAPAVLIIMSLGCVFNYHRILSTSALKLGLYNSTSSMPEILPKVQLWEIPYGEALILWYLGIFVFAEAAFIMMALREYLQDLLMIQEMELIYPHRAYKFKYLKSELLTAIAKYRKVMSMETGIITYTNFLDWVALNYDHDLIAAINQSPIWQKEIRERLTDDK